MNFQKNKKTIILILNTIMNNAQQLAFNLVTIKGKNIFLTGPGGVGKSYVIQQIVKWAESNDISIGITSMTGISAHTIGGRTLHSWFGCGLAKGTKEEVLSNLFFQGKMRLKKTKILIIDEVSMLSPELLETLDYVARNVRYNILKPFGGLQLVLCGDFAQLGAVKSDKFAFESPIWNELIQATVHLKEIVRQKDPVFQKCLNEVRLGECSMETLRILKQCADKKITSNENGIIPTLLYSKRVDVQRINDREITKLKSNGKPSTLFMGIARVESTVGKTITTKQRLIAETTAFAQSGLVQRLELTESAQVMLLRNLDIDNGLVNGSRGVVVKIQENSVMVRFMNGQTVEIGYMTLENHNKETHIMTSIYQIPLSVAYASTIHKTQSLTLDYVIVDLGRSVFACGQAYTALSRVKDLDGLFIEQFCSESIKTHPKVQEFYKKLEKNK